MPKTSNVVRVKVYDDGDTELTKLNSMPEDTWDARYIDNREELVEELVSYGFDMDRINRGLKDLEEVEVLEEIIL
jgi:hypothetical protein